MSASAEVLLPQFNFVTIQDYQIWAASDWIYEQGSLDAQWHARSKLEEEQTELIEALGEQDPDHIISELGDVLWTATASAYNAGITIEDSLRAACYPNVFSRREITIARVDELALEVCREEQSFDNVGNSLQSLALAIGKYTTQWHKLGSLIDRQDTYRGFSDAWIQLKEDRAKASMAHLIFLISALAQRECGKSLRDVMIVNAQKLSGRKARGEQLTKLPDMP